MNDKLIQLNAEYGAAINDDRLEDWPGFFTEDCLYRVTTRANFRRNMPAGLIYADSREMLADRVLSLRKANIYESQGYRHIISVPRIMATEGDDRWTVCTGFLVLRINRNGITDVFATGDYHDVVVRNGDSLLFEKRDVVCDSSRIDTLLAIPL